MKRTIFDDQHDAFREMFRSFLRKEVVSEFPKWEEQGYAPREFFRKLGDIGVTGFDIPEQYGGAGPTSYRYLMVIGEEAALAGVSLGNYQASSGIVLPYLLMLANEEQRARWLPLCARGEAVLSVAMTEPGTGSDLAAIRTTATFSPDGDHYVLNGAKTFITNASQATHMIVAARTGEPGADRRGGLSLFVLDTTTPGFEVGRRLDKIGLKFSDTCEVSFTDVRVPVGDLLGTEGAAFDYLGRNLPRERLAMAAGGCATAAAAIAHANSYTHERQVFGKPVASFQNTKFVLAECVAELAAAQALVDHAVLLEETSELSAVDAAICKLHCTEMAGRVIDKCLQLHGGYGYILEYPIARLYADTRVSRIYGGTNEVMKTIIAKSLSR
ncbi:acyl-CoA dehydrogenase family protein [Rhodococcus artemisiae]|uniref:Acyl-CoA dehydrogenase family protein n=1 Tax=Rhodococcus artemisiae TaxID=714159 RepID=A0ABU7LB95_9NOCA|nr:acyl-CoA dehydrogenase family protein [Rhodococcus artemisiae]MEE2058813.1 acyl-CoA dehydrogenase family protein [Rhodococcus artemisiae]